MSMTILRGGVIVCALLLAACGGGTSSGSSVPTTSLNVFEQELAGTYVLDDFTFIQPGEGGFRAEDFAAFDGELNLGTDGFAQIRVDLCEEEGADPEVCERVFAWTADAGWLYLNALDGEGANALATWETEGMGGLTTEFRVPTNHTECEQLLVEDGFEVFHWHRAP